MSYRTEALGRIDEIKRKHEALTRFSMRNSIRDDVQRMRTKYIRSNDKQPTRISLDAEAESKLTAYMVCFHISHNEDDKVEEILVSGIRQLGLKMFGMEVFFDCLDFCLD